MVTTTISSPQSFINSYGGTNYTVNSAVYDEVFSFFKTRTSSDAAAQQLTQYILILTYNNNLDPLAVIKELASSGQSDIKSLVITFFNNTSDPYSKLGYQNNNDINLWVKRNIIP